MKLLNRTYPAQAFALFVLFVACSFAVASCSDAADIEGTEVAGQVPVTFSSSVAPIETRAAGDATTANITSMGVFASHTGSNGWTTTNAWSFMFDQRVGRIGSGNPWTYSPVKYWPNTAGEKITFFAYAPHKDDCSFIQLKNANTQAGYPVITCTVPLQEASQRDILAAQPLIDRQRNTSSLTFSFRHMLAKTEFRVKSTSDITVTGLKLTDVSTVTQITLDGTTAPTDAGTATGTFVAAVSSTAPIDVNANATQTVASFYFGGFLKSSPKIQLIYKARGAADINTLTKEVDFPAGDFFWDNAKKEAKYTLFTLSVEGGEVNLAVSGVTIGQDWPSASTEINKGDITQDVAGDKADIGGNANIGNDWPSTSTEAGSGDLSAP